MMGWRLAGIALSLGLGLTLGLAPDKQSLADDGGHVLVLQDHRFEPAQLEIPAGQKVTLTITNRDAVTEEFDSPELHREKLIMPGATVSVTIGPMDPGTYHFIGEFHADTAHGVLIAK